MIAASGNQVLGLRVVNISNRRLPGSANCRNKTRLFALLCAVTTSVASLGQARAEGDSKSTDTVAPATQNQTAKGIPTSPAVTAANHSVDTATKTEPPVSMEEEPVQKPSIVDPSNFLNPNSAWNAATDMSEVTPPKKAKPNKIPKAAAKEGAAKDASQKVALANTAPGTNATAAGGTAGETEIAQASNAASSNRATQQSNAPGAALPYQTNPGMTVPAAPPAPQVSPVPGLQQFPTGSSAQPGGVPGGLFSQPNPTPAVQAAPSINPANRPFNSPPPLGGLPADISVPPNATQPGVGQTFTPPTLPASQAQQDFSTINQQANESAQRYLQGEAIELSLPQPNQLMSLGSTLPPIRLEANYTQPISLKDALLYSVDNNLSVRIANANKSVQKWLTVSQFGGFLPNAIMNFQHQLLSGQSLIGGVIPTSFHTPNTTAQAGFQWFGFQGGSVTFSSISQLHQFRAAREQLHGTVNDTLLAVTRAYYNLVQNQALLQIQTRAVEVSRAQVLLNQQLESAGTGTKFQVLQSDTQLARDEQNLLGQEVALRNSAIDLATTMNLNAAVNFLSVEQEIRKVRLIDPLVDINQLLAFAIINRPELKQYEHLRTAARRNIQVSASGLYPVMQFFGSVNGNGSTLGKSEVYTDPSFNTVAVNSSPTSSTIITPSAIIPNAAATLEPTGVGGNKQPLVGAADQYVPSQFRDRDMKASYIIGVRVDWNYPSLGVPQMANIMAAKGLARQALLNSNQQLLNVIQQVRESYLLSQTAEREIEVTTKAVISAAEELRLSRVRLANGVGTNIDVINSQRDFTTALVNKAQAIIQFNIAQAQLVHDIGIITVDNLTSGRLVRR
jgi:outer membrane protein TolC